MEVVGDVCARREPVVVAVGGGAVETRGLLDRTDTFVVHLDVDVGTAWDRVRGSERPLAQDEAEFRRRYERRRPLYAEAAHAVARDADDVVLAAAGIDVGVGALELLASAVPAGDVSLVTDPHVAGIHGATAQLALGERLQSTHELPPGEAAKAPDVAERLWRDLRLDRRGTLVALGGGSVTDVAGFVAATYLRGIAWVAVPTTLVGQVDAAIGGKTALDLPEGKNLVGAFHWPAATVIDPALLQTLPERERREGMAEVVKTGLLAGEPLWELPDVDLVRRCAAFKAAVSLRDGRAMDGTVTGPIGRFSDGLHPAVEEKGLTKREVVVLNALVEGKSNKEIARSLCLAEQTVKFHLTSLYRKLDVHGRTQAAHWAYRHGLVESSTDDEAGSVAAMLNSSTDGS